MKTSTDQLGALTEYIKNNHCYDVPEVIALPPVIGGSHDYLSWIANETRTNTRRDRPEPTACWMGYRRNAEKKRFRKALVGPGSLLVTSVDTKVTVRAVAWQCCFGPNRETDRLVNKSVRAVEVFRPISGVKQRGYGPAEPRERRWWW